MFLRIDKLGVELPTDTKYDPVAAAAVQELLGGRFGEMSSTTISISRPRCEPKSSLAPSTSS